MPVKKKADGWYFGSKGPFKTEKKAREVEQAAYTNGYKGKTAAMINKRKRKDTPTTAKAKKKGPTFV